MARKKAGAQLPLVETPADRATGGVAVAAGGASVAGSARQAEDHSPGRLTVARLTVHGVLGIEDSTIDLDTITVLEGANATGKSSHIKALRSALGVDRTSLARLARVDSSDAEGPSVEVLLVGEDREVQVLRKGDGSPEVRERVGEDWRKVPRPVEWLRQLVDVEAANPAAWLAADDETRAAAVLAAMPLEGYDRAAALAKAGLSDFRLPPVPAGLHPLEDLEHVEEAVFNARTEVNRQERAEHDAATKLLANLSAEPPGDVAVVLAKGDGEAARLAEEIAREEEAAESAHRQAIQAAASEKRLATERVTAAFKGEAAALRADHEAQAAQIRAEAERRIAELAAGVELAVEKLRAAGEEQIGEAEGLELERRAGAEEARAATVLTIEAKKDDLAAGRERLAALREQQRSADTDRNVRATAREAQEKAKAHSARSAALSAGIEALKRYRLELAEQLPIRGLAVKFDEKGRKSLTLDGVPLAQVNDSRLVELATEVSLLRNRPSSDARPYLPLVLLDGMERLDPKARAALLREIAARGSQVVAACVGTEALRALRGEAALGGEAA